MIRRWVVFNGVGVLGFAVQLAMLWALLALTPVHYLVATAAAVEAAVLHNFIWHMRYTWRDRRVSGRHAVLARLWRFHLLNGFVSLVGNVAIVAILTGLLGVHPLAANAVAVGLCSLVNFFGSEILVFRTATAAVALLLFSGPGLSARASEPEPAELQKQTVAAWQKYERVVEERYRATDAAAPRFFVHDAYGRDRAWRSAAAQGQVVMFQPERPSPGAAEIDVPDGKVHHWVGAIFVPNTTVDKVIARLLENAGRESDSYEDVLSSKLLSRNGNQLRTYLKLRREAVMVTVTYNTEHDVEFRQLSAGRAASRSVAAKIAEIARAGTPQEYEKKPGDDAGFLWRLNAYWRYEAVNGGVLIECESVSLSRGIPVLARLFVSGIVDRIARESLEKTLVTLRGVLGRDR